MVMLVKVVSIDYHSCTVRMLSIVFLSLVSGLLLPSPTVCHTREPHVYYVTPTEPPKSECPGEPCFTLDQYASNVSYYFSNAIGKPVLLLFLKGVHNLSQVLDLSTDWQSFPDSICFTTHDKSQVVTIQVAVELGGSEPLRLTSKSEILIEYLRIINGLTISLVSGNVTLSNMAFISSAVYVKVQSPTLDTAVNVIDSYFLLSFRKDQSVVSAMTVILAAKLNIENVSIADLHPDKPTTQSYTQGCSDIQCNCDLSIFPPYPDASMQVMIINSLFTRRSDCGIFFFPSTGYSNPSTAYSFNVNIVNTAIAGHQNGGIIIDAPFREPEFVNFLLMLSNVKVIGNHLSYCQSNDNVASGLAVLFRDDFRHGSFNSSTIGISESMFSGNEDNCGYRPVIDFGEYLSHNITILACEFRNNTGTPISVYNSNVYFVGNTIFSGNTGYRGGALFLSSSYIIFAAESIQFLNNTAKDVGGAIYIDQPEVQIVRRSSHVNCFYQVLDSSQIDQNKVLLSYNSARRGGDHIYGTIMHSYCIVLSISNLRGYQLYKALFDLEPPQSFSPVSSKPLRVCQCDINSKHATVLCNNISDIFFSKEVYPGEVFSISSMVVGADFGTTTGSVYGQFLPLHTSNPPSLAPQYQAQRVGDNSICTQLNYSIHSMNQKEILVLTATDSPVLTYGDQEALQHERIDSEPPILHFTTPIYINITLLDCPPGFILSNETHACVCDTTLVQNHIPCNFTNGTGYVYRSTTNWVNASFVQSGNYSGVVVHMHCPYGYCNLQSRVDLRYPDTQCNYHRSGTLCGQCQQNYSIALGNDKCLPCSDNSHLALLLFFIAAGFLLVIFIKVLNLTVSQGTINGLIFYANVVWAYRRILFPVANDVLFNSIAHGVEIFLQVFIAWLNLDFGIESCFFVGLDAYWKAWLQFVFPLYIWGIIGLIIFTAEHSTKIARLFGKNSVHILATLILFSYTKLLQTIITALNFTFLNYPDGTRTAVWSIDGNLLFCRFPHIILFLAAVVVMLVLWLPYTLSLLLAQWLKKMSHYRILRWVDNYRVRPFFDIYFAPFKDKHRYWVGVLLLTRIILLVTFSLTSATVPTANFLALAVTMAFLILYLVYSGYVYKEKSLSMLETSFFFNLLILATVSLYLDPNLDTYEETNAIVAYVSIGIVFVQFVCILCYHVWVEVSKYYRCKQHDRLLQAYENLDAQINN